MRVPDLRTRRRAHRACDACTCTPIALHASPVRGDTTLDGGRALYGHFYEGGFGVMRQSGAKLRAPWHFNGNSEMCVEFQKGAECFRYQKTGEFATEYRAIRVRDGLVIPVHIERGVPEY